MAAPSLGGWRPCHHRSTRHSIETRPELRERAVWMVQEAVAESGERFGAVTPHSPRGPWRTLEHVEVATAEWVDWWNHGRLHRGANDTPPAQYKEAYYRNRGTPEAA
jgi:transposase InsO family protein